MKNMQLFEAIGQLDEDLLERSEEDAPRAGVRSWVRWTALAACLCIVCGAAFLMEPWTNKEIQDNKPMESPQAPKEDSDINTSLEEPFYSMTDADSFDVHPIRTGADTGEYPRVTVISSQAVLQAYASSNQEILKESDFDTVTQEYDSAFFEKNQLIIAALDGESSSVVHDVLRVHKSDDGWQVVISRQVPAGMRSDLVYWQFLIELPGKQISEKDAITIQLQTKAADN